MADLDLWLVLFILIGLGSALYIVIRRRGRQPLNAGEDSALLKVQDVQFYVESLGHGPPLVLLHGIGASSFTFRLIAKELSRHYHVINVDLPGFGRSSKDPAADYGLDAQTERLLGLLDRLQISSAYLMGSSMGGTLSLWLGHLHPRRFPKIMALAPATSPARVWFNPRYLKWLFPVAPHFYSKALLSQIYRRVVTTPNLLTRETLEGYHKPYTDPKAVVTFLKSTELLRDPRLPQELAGIKSEVAILFGEKDKLVFKEDLINLIQILPKAHFSLHTAAGHHIHEDDPAWVLENALEFFKL